MSASTEVLTVTPARETTELQSPQPGGGLRGLWQLVASRRALLGAACLTSALGAVSGLGAYLSVYAIAQEVLKPAPSTDAIWRAAIGGVLGTLLKFVLAMSSHALAHAGAFSILYDLRVRLARKLGDVPLGFFSRHQTSSLQKALNDDVAGLEAFLAHMLPDAAAAFTVPLAALAVMVAVDWRMALAAFAAVPVAVLAQVSMLRGSAKDSYEEYHRATEATKSAVLEFLRGIHVVKAFALSSTHFGALEKAVNQMTAYVEAYARKSAPPFIVALKLLGGGTNALFIVPVGVWLHQNGTLDTATLLFFLLVGTQVLSPFLRIANVLGNLQLLLKGADHLQRLLDEPSLPRTGSATPRGHQVRFDGVTFAYGDTAVLHDVSFEAPAGKVTAIVGASGSGKSTLVRLIARFWDVGAGRLEVGGVDVRELDLDAHLARVSLVFQDVFLFRGTVRENLRLAKSDASDAELEAACRVARVHDVVMGLPHGYDTLLGERGTRLSGGEKQRLSLARAVLKDAPLLLLDEATAFADAENEALIHQALAEVTRGKTVIVIAHRLSTIRSADQVVVLDRGRVIDRGPHDEVVTRCEAYQQLWRNYEAAGTWALDAAEVTP
jgi:ATP-binding cassette subfamily B protein